MSKEPPFGEGPEEAGGCEGAGSRWAAEGPALRGGGAGAPLEQAPDAGFAAPGKSSACSAWARGHQRRGGRPAPQPALPPSVLFPEAESFALPTWPQFPRLLTSGQTQGFLTRSGRRRGDRAKPRGQGLGQRGPLAPRPRLARLHLGLIVVTARATQAAAPQPGPGAAEPKAGGEGGERAALRVTLQMGKLRRRRREMAARAPSGVCPGGASTTHPWVWCWWGGWGCDFLLYLRPWNPRSGGGQAARGGDQDAGPGLTRTHTPAQTSAVFAESAAGGAARERRGFDGAARGGGGGPGGRGDRSGAAVAHTPAGAPTPRASAPGATDRGRAAQDVWPARGEAPTSWRPGFGPSEGPRAQRPKAGPRGAVRAAPLGSPPGRKSLAPSPQNLNKGLQPRPNEGAGVRRECEGLGVRAGQALRRPQVWGPERGGRGPQAPAGLEGGLRHRCVLKPCSNETRGARPQVTFISVGTNRIAN